MIGVRRNPVKAKPVRKVTLIAMLELPDFAPLRVTRSRRALTHGALDSLDQLPIVDDGTLSSARIAAWTERHFGVLRNRGAANRGQRWSV
jgi:hypothetical protein